MKHLKKSVLLISLLFFFLLSTEVKSQFAIAGINGSLFTDIFPDTVLNPYPPSFASEIYNIDINHDLVDDIKIESYAGISPGSNNATVLITALNASTSFSFGSRDSSFVPANPPCGDEYWVRTILRIYNIGDTIKDGIYVSEGYLTYRRSLGPCNGAISSQWLNQNNVCFGVKYQTLADTYYGWVKLDVVSQYVSTIKDFSLGSPSSNITENNQAKFISVYPNPFNSSTTINFNKPLTNDFLYINNVYGQLILKVKITGQYLTINRSDLPAGVYYFSLQNGSPKFSSCKLIIFD